MDNEELKKKIVEIIISAIWKDAEADYDSTDETEACSIADALIAAGIGDVKEAEHRAKVAERAVENLVRARNYLAAQIYIEVENGDALTVDYYMRQAERQLAKEEENGND